MTDGDDRVAVAEADLHDLYGLLADATEAAATGDSNTCAMKASDAKKRLVALHRDATPVPDLEGGE